MYRIIFSGFGGQGVLTLGQLVSTMAMNKGFQVTWLPSYGAEMRGGTANCAVVISEDAIGSPLVSKPDILVAFNGPSVEKFLKNLRPEGTVIINSSIINLDKAGEKQRLIKIDATNAATELGNLKVQNMVMLGAFMKALPIFTLGDAIQLINEKFGKKYPQLVELNVQAVKKGME